MANATSKHTARLEVGRDETLMAADLKDWIAALPPHAEIHAITREVGHQRDPWTKTVGLGASWED